MKTYVAYLRSSTTKLGVDGLGLAAQKQAIKAFNGNVIAKFVEVESGKSKDRPELARALEHCKLTDSVLIIAKLGRLARNVNFISSLMESDVDFLACDLPEASRLTLRVMAVFAKHEAQATSILIKAALAQAKAQGVKLGNPNFTSEGRITGNIRGLKTIKAIADQKAARVIPTIKSLKGQGYSLRGVAGELNRMGEKTPRKKLWTATAVKNALGREI